MPVGEVRKDRVPDQRLLRRVARRLAPSTVSLRHLTQTIHTLLQVGGGGDPFVLSKSLELLVRHLGASQAVLVMVAGTSVELRWWFPEVREEAPPALIPSFCEWLLSHPERTLVIRDMATGPHLSQLGDPGAIPHKAACALNRPHIGRKSRLDSGTKRRARLPSE